MDKTKLGAVARISSTHRWVLQTAQSPLFIVCSTFMF